ncbi:MAG: PqqD family protein [Pseudomonadales bacterium]
MQDSTYQISDEVLFQEIAGEAVLLDLDGEEYFGLNEVGTRVWQLLQNGESVNGMIGLLLEEYQVAEAQLREDVEGLLSQFQERGLISAVT